MKYQRELRKSKTIVRDWIRANFSDQRLASLAAFNMDGKMTFRNPCACLIGVTHSARLHADEECSREHYWLARRRDVAQTSRFAALFSSVRIGRAEKAYLFLGFSVNFSNCFGDDELRRRRFAAILRAEMRRRARLHSVREVQPAFDVGGEFVQDVDACIHQDSVGSGDENGGPGVIALGPPGARYGGGAVIA